MDLSEAPWDDTQVASLHRWQADKRFHPFTCPNRGDGRHIDVYNHLGALLPTPVGWVCASCDYTQTWAHQMMTEAAP